jgi:hypothetical protein
MTREPIAVVVMAGLCSVLLSGQAPATDPIDGTWKLSLPRSTYSPGPPPKGAENQLRRFSTLEGGWNLFEFTGTTPEGAPVFQIVAFKIDGKPYPVYSGPSLTTFLTAGKPTNVTRSYRRIDTLTTEFTTYTSGVAGIPTVRTVSKDGKTYTETTKGKNNQGQAVNNTLVFERVR